MFDNSHLNKRSLHRRAPGIKKLQARFLPTYVWSDPATNAPAATPAASPAASTPAAQQTPPPAASSPPIASPTPAPAQVTSPAPSQVTPAAVTPSTSDPAAQPSSSAPPALSDTPSSSSTPIPSTPAASTPLPVTASPVAASVSNPTLSRSFSSPTLSHTGVTAAGLASPSASATGTAVASISTGAVIGGVIAGIAGLAGLIFAVTWFMRRARRDEDDFSADAFRRQSVVLPDTDMPRGGNGIDWDERTPQTPMFERRVNAPPPVMFERRMQVPPPSQGWVNYQAQQSPGFSPGQYVTMQDNSRRDYEPDLSIQTPNSAQPFFSPMGQSPIGSPVSVAPYGSVYDNQQPPVTRQNSLGASAYLSRQPSMNNGTLGPPEAHYVDLSRSSVTPFQAEQYEEISRRLNAPPPTSLPAVVEHQTGPEESVHPVIAQSEPEHVDVGQAVTTDEPQDTTESPFADPEGQDSPMVTPNTLPDGEDGDDMAFPQPPSPAFSSSTRINSTPPVLPEIHIQQRAFSPVSMDFPSVPNPSRPAPTPSPLASSYTPPALPADAHITDKPAQQPKLPQMVVDPAAAQLRSQKDETAKRPDTVYTMYDEEDAYGGI